MIKVGLYAPVEHPRLRYTVSFLNRHPLARQAGVSFYLNGLQEPFDIRIAYSAEEIAEGSYNFRIPPDAIFLHPLHQEVPIFFAGQYDWNGKRVYSVSAAPTGPSGPLIVDQVFQFDLLATIFFHLSRLEERVASPDETDESGWLCETRHFLVRHQLEKRPVVDELIAVFLTILTGQPLALPTTYDLTHDIDFLFRFPNAFAFLRSILGKMYRREGFPRISKTAAQYRGIILGKAKDPFDSFDWLLSSSPRWQHKCLFLMAGGETAYDNHYQLTHPYLKKVIELARNRGYHLGLHPSYNAGLKPTLFFEERKNLETVLGRPIHYSRQHWLRFNWQITPAIFQQAAIREDASVGYRRRLGFRCGTGFPYHLYDFRSEQAFSWRERPLALMESAAIHESKRQGIPLPDLLDQFIGQNSLNTHLSINFHNSNFDPDLASGRQLRTFYQDNILKLPG